MSTDDLPASINHVITPCMLVDIDKVKRNCLKLIDISKKMGVSLRPHMKTHKTIEAGVIATGGTRRCIVVSTLDEAEFYADNSFDDILLGRLITPDKIPRCQKLANRLEKFHVMYDTETALKWFKETPLDSGKQWSLVLKVDTGYGRTGVLWDSDDVISIAKAAVQAPNTTFLGVYTHCGNSYDVHGEKELKEFGDLNTNRLLSIRDRLKKAGVECPMVATGSTPSCSVPADSMSQLTEFHPGCYIFYDIEHVLIGACSKDEVAIRVATRVLTHKPSLNQLVVDCGFTAISHDGIADRGKDFVVIQDNDNLRLVNMSQELGKVRPHEGDLDFSKYPIGSMLFFYPFHACATSAMHPVYYVHSGEKIVGVWRPTRGW